MCAHLLPDLRRISHVISGVLLPPEHSCILLVFLFFVYRKGTRNNVNVPLFISLYRSVYCEEGGRTAKTTGGLKAYTPLDSLSYTRFAVQFVTFA